VSAKGLASIDAILNTLVKNEGGTPLGFHNHSQLDFYKLKGDPDNIGRHLADYIAGFSENVRKIFDRFEFNQEIDKLEESNRLYQVVAQFAEIDLHPNCQGLQLAASVVRRRYRATPNAYLVTAPAYPVTPLAYPVTPLSQPVTLTRHQKPIGATC